MEPSKIDPPKLSDMVMCGDHPSVTKTELNVKEERPEAPDQDRKDRSPAAFIKASPTSSGTERARGVEARSRALSEHALRLLEARRRARSADLLRADDAPPDRALVHAALGSFRWPPYLVAVWVVVLLLTHLLHCLVTMLERALPPLRKFCGYLRAWTEEAWRSERGPRGCPLALAAATGALYALYCALYAAHALALWAIEPLAEDAREDEPAVTDYVGDAASRTDATLKA